MQCQRCGERPATVHMTKIVNGQKTEMHLCEQCANEVGELNFSIDPEAPFVNLFSSLFENPGMAGAMPAATDRRCPNCGLSYDDFRRLGQLGCSECYEAFERELDPLLRRLHGATTHTGKTLTRQTGSPASLRRQIEELRRTQTEAIRKEEYERAAELRDKIRELEKKLRESGGGKHVD